MTDLLKKMSHRPSQTPWVANVPIYARMRDVSYPTIVPSAERRFAAVVYCTSER